MFTATVSAATVINRVAKNADFGHKEGKGFEKGAAHPYSTFLEVPLPGPITRGRGQIPYPTRADH